MDLAFYGNCSISNTCEMALRPKERTTCTDCQLFVWQRTGTRIPPVFSGLGVQSILADVNKKCLDLFLAIWRPEEDMLDA